MPGISKIQYNRKEILFIDYKGTKSDDEMIDILKQAQEIIIRDNKEYYQLINVQGAYVTPKYLQEAKRIAKETPKLAKKRAIVGIDSPGRKILLTAYNLVIGKDALKPFDDLERAKAWLVKP